jgi:hypothetical protein
LKLFKPIRLPKTNYDLDKDADGDNFAPGLNLPQ